jgi:PPP family 3-phenylpropionic acid transporter
MSLFLQWTPVIKPDSAIHIAFWIVFTLVVAAFPVLFIPAKIKAQAEPAAPLPARPEAKTAFVTPRFVCGILIMFLCMLAMSPLFFFFPLYVTEALGWNSIGLLVAISAASQVPLLFLFSRLLRRFGSTALLAVSAFCIAARLLVDAFLPLKAWIIAGQFFDCFGSGIFHAAAIAFITETVPPENRGVGVSIYLSLGSGLPKLAGNILGGAILTTAGKDALRSGYPILFFVFSLFAFLAIGVYFTTFFRRGSKVPAACL